MSGDLAQLPPPTTQPAATKLAHEAIEAELERVRAHVHEAVAPTLAEASEILRDHLAASIASLVDDAVRASGLLEAIAERTQGIPVHASRLGAIVGSGYRSSLYALASEHHGFVTTDMARAVGVPAVEVRKLAARGGMTNIARGLYRVDGIEVDHRAPFAEAILRVGEGAHLLGDSVLAFHDLARVNPRRIRVGTTRRVRRDLPAHITLVHVRTGPADLTEYDGIPSMTVAAAIRTCIGTVMPDRLREAVERAVDEGLVRRRDASALLTAIGGAA